MRKIKNKEKKNPLKIYWEYCECGCKGSSSENTKPYDYWYYYHLHDDDPKKNEFSVYVGHGHYGLKLGVVKNHDEIDALVLEDMRKRVKDNDDNSFKILLQLLKGK